jgi:alginate O-acetyltransferase complex protein AlgI
MIFNSLDFFYLVVITFGLYYLPALRRVQFPVLIGASFVFYAWNFPALLLLLLFSIFVNALGSYGVAYSSSAGRQRSIAVASVVVNVLLLALFKYAGLIGTTFFKGQHQIVDYLVAIPLPVGISFFTFQGISLVVDTFRERDLMCRQGQVSKSFWLHLMNTSLFISLFPQLVAGPIVKAKYFFPQIRYKFLKDIEWEEVFRMVVVGYFLKMVVADNLKDFTFELTWPYFERLSSVHLLVLLFAYSIQIFADFAGYSLIAIGLSLLFGYRIPQNFNFPYVATSFADFWRRWHISLSSFLKEYLYIPLGGNRRGRFRTYLNLLIVMALGGLWHGAAWSYMLWGTAHGLFLALERFLKDYAGVVGGVRTAGMLV